MARRFALALLAATLLSSPAAAGPPFQTDDPEPTADGHWEIYGPYLEAEGIGGDYGGEAGIEVNYGAAPDLQLTIALPLEYAHDSAGLRAGTGDLAASVKYRFVNDEAHGFQLAVFPGITLPTAGGARGAGHVTALLPVWGQLDRGPWSVFGGGGYAINPGAGNRDFWTGGIAVTRQTGERTLIGVEADRSGPDTRGGRAATSFGLGLIRDLTPPFRVLFSGGPTFEDGGGDPGFHAYAAIGMDF